MFEHSVIPPNAPNDRPLVCYFVGRLLLVEIDSSSAMLPLLAEEEGRVSIEVREAADRGAVRATEYAVRPAETANGVQIERRLFIGRLDGRPCYAVELHGRQSGSRGDSIQTENESGFVLRSLRSLMGVLDGELLRVAGIAAQVLDWDRNHQFCGRCGTPTVVSERDRSRTCPSCSLSAYPRISPAIIVAVTKGDRLLLAHNRRHRGDKVFSVIAGFVEPGESLEECVRREIREEVSIEVESIRYFASQPWPFPDSLMLAFTANHRSGDIVPDGEEIIEAGWYDRDSLPRIPPHGTIARTLIDAFLAGSLGRGEQ